eukprot:TRINITY_DN1424_c0_g1_i1.p1 TRINITY_DN1424_c0_g1~~TRINITY_DN1424_c0_g1_i1.p1  ORF type:complete len:353 (-),score=123.81 TRINITY_DN1424_c0_g1_i1:54-1112(-)
MSAVPMQYRFLGRSGLRVSVLSIGAWITQGSQVDEDAAFECMKAAYDNGCNFFDNAEVYAAGKAEEVMGICLKRLNVPRDELVISTKLYWGGDGVNQRGLSRKHIIEGTRASLKRMQLDYVDLLFCHRPDPYTPIEETVRAMNFLIDQGLIFYWGTSEWSAEEIADAHGVASRLGLVGPVMEQPQYSMLHRTRFEKEYVRLYKDYGLGTTIWSPLACGLLTGKYSGKEFPEDTRLGLSGNNKWLRDQLLSGKGMNGLEEKNLDRIYEVVDGLKPIAAKLNCTLAQLALAWCIKNENVSTVITGASRPSQVVENFKSLEVVPKLTKEVMEEIEKVLNNKPQLPNENRLGGKWG